LFIDVALTGLVVKASEGTLHGFWIANANAAARFLKIYNKATAPTAADTPVMTLRLAPTSSNFLSISGGIRFSAGISMRATTAIADNDVGAPTANDVCANLFYF